MFFLALLLFASGVGAAHFHAKPSPRIILGEEVSAFSHSLYCTLYVDFQSDSGTSLCGCALYAAESVVTAAHCFVKVDPVNRNSAEFFSAARVRLYGPSRKSERLLRVDPSRVRVHPNYSPYTFRDDVAFFSLPGAEASDVVVNEDPEKWTSLTLKDKLTVIGVGLDEFDAYSLGAPKTTFLSRRDCENPSGPGDLLGWRPIDHMNDICTGPFSKCEGDSCADACFGDSGGPLFSRDENGTLTLYGIVSRGDPTCGKKGGYPTLYAPTAKHANAFFVASPLENRGDENSSLYLVKQYSSDAGKKTAFSTWFYIFLSYSCVFLT